ncbi:MAG TPA: hypothetical protein VF278_17175, partial [Pirellulales bacterium]
GPTTRRRASPARLMSACVCPRAAARRCWRRMLSARSAAKCWRPIARRQVRDAMNLLIREEPASILTSDEFAFSVAEQDYCPHGAF